MNGYRIKISKIFAGIIMLAIALALLLLSYNVAILYINDSEYVTAIITEFKRVPPDDENGEVQLIIAEHREGVHLIEHRLPAHLWYWEGMGIGDEITIPRSDYGFEDMDNDEIALFVIITAAGVIFLLSAVAVIAGEIRRYTYIKRLVQEDKYVLAEVRNEEEIGGKIRAVCGYGGEVYITKLYNKNDYPFEGKHSIKVYVDTQKDSEKYFISEE